jgi:hypothetical protein
MGNAHRGPEHFRGLLATEPAQRPHELPQLIEFLVSLIAEYRQQLFEDILLHDLTLPFIRRSG